jgi:hypothetical protein
MRRLSLTILGAVLLCTATAGWAAEPPTVSVPVEESLNVPAAPEPVSIDLLFSTPQQTPAAALPCPAEPIVTCNDCFYFGQYLTYRCTTFCYNGTLRRSCGSCGSGCDP